ncbi:MAG TPA: hypothetical protein VK212_05180 [Lentimicrobium sp.]|nr:hypothetical protein [Lentimicrobium sp.]
MHLYRFRLLAEEQEDFLRDYDILASQTFLEFHDLIKETVELKGNELASFFVCDRNWRKKKEITLLDMQAEEDQAPVDEDDEEKPKLNRLPTFEMAKMKIKEVIDDPHQRLLFEYDFLNPKTFYIELMKIIDADKNEKYPKCVKSVGKLVPVAITNLPFIPDEETDVPLPGEFDEITMNDDDNNDDLIIDTPPDLDKEW